MSRGQEEIGRMLNLPAWMLAGNSINYCSDTRLMSRETQLREQIVELNKERLTEVAEAERLEWEAHKHRSSATRIEKEAVSYTHLTLPTNREV